MGPTEKIALPAAFYFDPLWSPDSKKIAFRDSNLQLWYLDLDKKTPVKIDQDTYDVPSRAINPAWAPDSKWITYTRLLHNHLRALHVFSIETGKATQISDGMSDAEFSNFDKNGKYLYFTASTNLGLSGAWLDMSSDEHPVTRSVYLVVLKKGEPSPVAPESDEEGAAKDNQAPDRRTLAGIQEPASEDDKAPVRLIRETECGESEAGRGADRFRKHRPADRGAAHSGAQLRGDVGW